MHHGMHQEPTEGTDSRTAIRGVRCLHDRRHGGNIHGMQGSEH